MINVCKCEYEVCPNSQNCKRFKEAVGEIMLFKFICNESNNFQWIMKINEDLEILKIIEKVEEVVEVVENIIEPKIEKENTPIESVVE